VKKVPLKTYDELQIMREGGKILATIHEKIRDNICIGMSALQLDEMIYNWIISADAKPSFLGYSGFPNSACISKNEEIVHGIPTADKKFLPGDIVSVDVGVFYKGFHVDAARTWPIGSVDEEALKLIKVTEESFFRSVKEAVPGAHLGNIGHSLQTYVESQGLSVVRDLCSHGVGKKLHEEPMVPNYGRQGTGWRIKEGFTFALEPMVNIGTFKVLTLADKWTIITADKKWSAHYENTVHVGPDGPEILTI